MVSPANRTGRVPSIHGFAPGESAPERIRWSALRHSVSAVSVTSPPDSTEIIHRCGKRLGKAPGRTATHAKTKGWEGTGPSAQVPEGPESTIALRPLQEREFALC